MIRAISRSQRGDGCVFRRDPEPAGQPYGDRPEAGFGSEDAGDTGVEQTGITQPADFLWRLVNFVHVRD